MTDQRVHPDAARWGGWLWREPSRGEHFRRCSFCGSISPEDLVAEPAWRAEWADQKYGWPHKFYVDIPNRQPDQLFVVSVTWSDQPPKPLIKGQEWIPVGELSAEQLVVAQRDRNLEPTSDGRMPTYLSFSTRPAHHAKFYSIHLRDAELAGSVKETIERISGAEFDFLDDGRVAWRRAGGGAR